MPLTTADVGKKTEPYVQTVDARWVMAYAASLGDFLPCYMDTRPQERVIAHPLFPVAVEWEPIMRQSRQSDYLADLLPAERMRGVHGAHDLHIHRNIRAGDTLSTQITQIGVQKKRAGVIQISKLESHNDAGDLVSSTYMQSLFRSVDLIGEDLCIESPPPLPEFSAAERTELEFPIQVRQGLAHVYTECSRIWSPIHTDRAVASAAGLPDLILHGTCTLALAVSKVIKQFLDDEPARVTRVGCRFSSMVLMPSTLTLRVSHRGSNQVAFDVLNPDGAMALTQGFVCWK
jgi:acyl dehydratase